MTLDELIKKYKPHEVDFVFPKTGDTRAYMDLYSLYHSPDERWHKVHTLIFEYFNYHLRLYKKGKIKSEELIEKLHFPEVPFVALGHCKDGIYGAGSADDRATVLKDSIFDNEELKKVGISALAGTSITIGGLGPDLLSDMVANFAIRHLLEYTTEQVQIYGLKTAEFPINRALEIEGFEWSPLLKVCLPYFENGEPRIFVPKHITKRLPIYTTEGYYDNYLKYLLQEEKGDRLKTIRAIGKTPKVSLKQIELELKKKYGTTGEAAREIGLKKPRTVEGYLKDPFYYKKFHTRKKKEKIEWSEYSKELRAVKTGKAFARKYADTVRKIFTALYGEGLVNGVLEERSYKDMFHYDINFANAANTRLFTFFKNQQIKAGIVIFEAKNYNKTKLSNGEFNQANGYGIVNGRELIVVVTRDPITDIHIEKCRRYFLTHKILLLPISDADIIELLDSRKNNPIDFDNHLIQRAQKILSA